MGFPGCRSAQPPSARRAHPKSGEAVHTAPETAYVTNQRYYGGVCPPAAVSTGNRYWASPLAGEPPQRVQRPISYYQAAPVKEYLPTCQEYDVHPDAEDWKVVRQAKVNALHNLLKEKGYRRNYADYIPCDVAFADGDWKPEMNTCVFQANHPTKLCKITDPCVRGAKAYKIEVAWINRETGHSIGEERKRFMKDLFIRKDQLLNAKA